MKCRFSLLFVCAVLCLLLLGSCGAERTRYVIGVSQCSDDAWRSQMNQEIRREALFYPQARVEFRSAHDDSRRQIADIEAFIREGVNLIVVAPNEADAMAPVIEKAYRQGIPVVLVDRKSIPSSTRPTSGPTTTAWGARWALTLPTAWAVGATWWS